MADWGNVADWANLTVNGLVAIGALTVAIMGESRARRQERSDAAERSRARKASLVELRWASDSARSAAAALAGSSDPQDSDEAEAMVRAGLALKNQLAATTATAKAVEAGAQDPSLRVLAATLAHDATPHQDLDTADALLMRDRARVVHDAMERIVQAVDTQQSGEA